MKKIGFIGVGIMGKSMVRNLMKAGYELHIYARTKAKVEDVIGEGAIFHETISECVKDCEAVITIVGFPQDVEEVYFDSGNILDSAKKGAYLIDMTTTSPQIAEKLYEEGTKRGFHVLDAPVTGGDTGAREGTLSILVGGDKSDYANCQELFEAMGTNINYEGSAGCGQHCKLANQIMIAGTLSGVCEALTYAKEKGLDLNVFSKSVATGAAGSRQFDLFGPKIIEKDYAPGFFMKHFIKDMKLALIEANRSGLNLEVLTMFLPFMKSLKQTATEISEHRHLSNITSKSKLYRTRTERIERTMLEIKELTKYYGKNLAVDQVTFTVPNGQVGVLLGPNGSGKSTIIKSIAGLLRYQGEIRIKGIPARQIPAKRKFAYVPEIPNMFDALTVREHIEYVRMAYDSEITDEEIEKILKAFEMDDKQDKLGNELSKGMMQKVSICCALAVKPEVILLDEPMVGLDPAAIKMLKDVVLKLRDNGATVLISTHMLEMVENLWDVMIVMEQGHIAGSYTKADAQGKELDELFFEMTGGEKA